MPELVKGGVVRRALALVVDLIVIEFVLQLVAAVAFQLSGGALIDSNSVYTSCETTTERPARIAAPQGWQTTDAQLCTKSIFGWPTARLYVLSRTDAGTHLTTSISYAVDPSDQLKNTFDLAGLQMLALVLMRWGLERRQLRSLGRRFLALAVVPRVPDVTVPVLRSALLRRYACFIAILLPPLIVSLVAMGWQLTGAPFTAEGAGVFAFLGHLPATVGALAALGAILRGQDAFYDQAAHTTVALLTEGGVQVASERRTPVRSLHHVVGGLDPWFAVPWGTFCLVALLVAVFLGELLAGFLTSHITGINATVLVLFGGQDGELVRQVGQWYRLLTAIFLHANEPHLVANVVVLLIAGWLLEPLIGWPWLIATFLFGGLAASLTSIVFNPPTFLSVGASGAITAVIAAGLVISFGLAQGQRRLWLRAFTLACLAASLQASGQFAWGTIDRADHLGGALGGLVMGLAMLALWRRSEPHPRVGSLAMGSVLSVCAALLVSIPIAGFGGVPLPALLIPADQLPKTEDDWIARSADLVRRYPRDPRAHLARAVALADDPLKREQELAALTESQKQLVPVDLPKAQQNAFATVGLNRLKARDWSAAKDLFTRAIMTTAPDIPEIFALRAQSEQELGEFESALLDERRRSSLAPTDVNAHIAVADGLFHQGQTGSAIAELDKAVALALDNGLALRQRGWAEFFNSRSDDALRDLEMAARLMPDDSYAALWLDIAAVRSGHADRLAALSKGLSKDAWPAPVIELYAGDIDVEELMVAAGDRDAVKQEGQRCEANFYYAELLLMRHEDAKAGPYLQNAATQCPKGFYEWPSAHAELSGAAGFHKSQAE